jgi:hypothetical protein
MFKKLLQALANRCGYEIHRLRPTDRGEGFELHRYRTREGAFDSRSIVESR